jgi:hypothetical protein
VIVCESPTTSDSVVLVSTVVNVLLTGAIAFAGIMQWLVSGRLLDLQRVVENQHTKVWLFLRMKGAPLSGHDSAQVQISNLSQVGVWVEKVTVHVEVPAGTPNKAKAILIECILPPMLTKADVDIRAAVHEMVQPGVTQVPATVHVEVEFWVNGLWQREKTSRYSMVVQDQHLRNVKPA